jgi:hypothetical protein
MEAAVTFAAAEAALRFVASCAAEPEALASPWEPVGARFTCTPERAFWTCERAWLSEAAWT